MKGDPVSFLWGIVLGVAGTWVCGLVIQLIPALSTAAKAGKILAEKGF